MLTQLKGRISQAQMDEIVTRMIAQYERFLKFAGTDEYKELFASELASHREQHTATWAIMSEFLHTNIGDLTSKVYRYGIGHTKIELCNDKLVMHIVGAKFDPKAKDFLKNCEMNKQDFCGQKLFCYIQLCERGNKLSSVSICIPDENGKVAEGREEEIISRKELYKQIA